MEYYPEWLIILLGMLVKHLIRRLFSASSRLHSQELSNRLMFLTEHVVFSCWAYYCVYHVPETASLGSSWLFNTPLLWVGAGSPSLSLLQFYLGKVATHLEDLLVIFKSILIPQNNENHHDFKMIVHHIATALLCLASWYWGYLRVGSSIMLLHDVSDVPLDLVRVTGALKHKTLQIISMVCTLIAWAYWRLYFLPFKIVPSVLTESCYSPFEAATDPNLEYFVVKKRIYAALIGCLGLLHYLWFWMMLKKSYREIVGDKKKEKIV